VLTRIRRLAAAHAERAADAKRGERFITRFHERAHIPRAHPRRLFRILLGFALLAFGFANIFIPGPGGSVFILGSALVLSGESRLLARLFDRGEVRFGRQVDWVLRRPIVAVTTVSVSVLVVVALVGAFVA
jgi:hypothetical protein